MAYNFTAIEKKWQNYWLENRSFRALEPAEAGDMPKAYVLDMFPYPSGAGLHVGHPEGYTATDIVSRYLRMKGHNVLHPMGWDAFGLPAEQYAIKTNTHPRTTTELNINNFRRQIQMLGLSYDWEREVDTTDPGYYKWTQWIFLQLYNSYFDPIAQKAMPISHLEQELLNENYVVAPDGRIVLNPTTEGMESIAGEMRIERLWREFDPADRQDIIDTQRLAYVAEVPVNWCPGLGTVLANEEVVDGVSEVGKFPVERRPMRQWMLRITAYSDRLIEDLNLLDWPESLKEMQRNWIGRSVGAEVDFEIDPESLRHADQANVAQGSEPTPRTPGPIDGESEPVNAITVFTTRPDTLYGATYMVLAPEHELVDRITAPERRETIEAYRTMAAARSERDRMADAREKTGVFTGAYAINPVNDEKIPVYIADYVLTGYGTGAIMAVPAHDERDYEFAKKFELPIRTVVRPVHGEAPADKAFADEGIAINSDVLNDLPTAEAKERIINLLEREGTGHRSIKYKLRDWLFSRQRYWGEPFPLLIDGEGRATALREEDLPILLPEMTDFRPTGTPEPPLSKATDWLQVQRDGIHYTRETNTMPQWAGSCWYYLRYIDPKNTERFIDPEKEKYWMPVDLYVGGVEHAVLHLLYARFWHKVLFDLGHVSTPEPFRRLVNQGLILGEAEYSLFQSADGSPISLELVKDVREEATDDGLKLVANRRDTGEKVTAVAVTEDEIDRKGDTATLKRDPSIRVDARSFKMSKSRGNVVNPDAIVQDYGADTFRLYEMYMGPLEAPKPWNTRDIVGMHRFLKAAWRNLIGDDEETPATETPRIVDGTIAEDLNRQLHFAIRKVASDIEGLRFNTAIAELIKLNNEIGRLNAVPRALAESFTLLLAPFAPHLAEEIWQRLGHGESLARHAWPTFDESTQKTSTIELPVQVNGKVRDKIVVAADATEDAVFAAAASAEKVVPWLADKTIRKRLYVPKKLVNFVVG